MSIPLRFIETEYRKIYKQGKGSRVVTLPKNFFNIAEQLNKGIIRVYDLGDGDLLLKAIYSTTYEDLMSTLFNILEGLSTMIINDDEIDPATKATSLQLLTQLYMGSIDLQNVLTDIYNESSQEE